MQISPDTDIHLRINRHTAPTWKTCWMRNTAHCWAPRHRDSRVQQDEEDEHKKPKNWSLVFLFFGLKCLRLKCKQDDSHRHQQRACGSFHCSLNQVFYTLIIQPLSTPAGHRNALQQQTPTEHGQLIYCFHEAELIHDWKRAASWTQKQTSKKKIHG